VDPFITTYPSRKKVNPLDLRPEDIVLEDVAHHLAIQNRWAGASREPLSTAQHAVYVSKLAALLANQGYTPIDDSQWRELLLLVSLQGLHHDDSEYILGDVTKWLKESPPMKAYCEAEDRAQTMLYRHWGLSTVMSPPVLEADKLMVRFEGAFSFGRDFVIREPDYPAITDKEWDRIKIRLGWQPWDWRYAEMEYLRTHEFLTHRLEDLRDRRARKDMARAT